MTILLINPPFAMPDKPPLSVPTLAGHLKSKCIPVGAIDLNIEYYRRLLSPDRIDKEHRNAKDRFLRLSKKSRLDPDERRLYLLHRQVLEEPSVWLTELSDLFVDRDRPNIVQMDLFRRAVLLTTLRYYPEYLDFTESTQYIRHVSKHKKFSTSGILESVEDRTCYSRILKGILDALSLEEPPDIVGISITFPDQILPAVYSAKIIKNQMPTAHVTMGGTFVSCHMREIDDKRMFQFFDSLVLDDGEVPLEQLYAEVLSGRPKLNRIAGLVFCENGKIVKNKRQGRMINTHPPAPDYSVLPLDRYLINPDSMALLFRLSHGCYWGQCCFCKTKLPFINDYYQINPSLVYSQLKDILSSTGIKIFHFADESARPEVLEYLSKQIMKDGLNINWVANIRCDKDFTIERCMLYRKAGCRFLYVGVESLTQRILALMKKGITEPLVNKVLSNISWAGIPVVVYMIVGFPTETEAEAIGSFRKVVSFQRKGMIKNCIYNVFEMSPFSSIYSNPEQFGITECESPPGQNLMPVIDDFVSSGMTRERAKELCFSFVRELNS
ncbi:MAG: radical SAM protein [Deltaproteobacteria bacterium]|nr:radical SAM protein [Deltaproteobacteria bacterium]